MPNITIEDIKKLPLEAEVIDCIATIGLEEPDDRKIIYTLLKGQGREAGQNTTEIWLCATCARRLHDAIYMRFQPHV
jgi:hypothetical protein